MNTPPRTQELADTAGISKSYASEILSGSQAPSRALAIHIMQTTGWRHSLLDGLSDDQIDLLATVDRWVPAKDRAA